MKDIDKKCKVEVFSRVTGFFRPVQSWNKGKAEEFKHRKVFNLNKIEEVENESTKDKIAECASN